MGREFLPRDTHQSHHEMASLRAFIAIIPANGGGVCRRAFSSSHRINVKNKIS
jgi:hypothetical protein